MVEDERTLFVPERKGNRMILSLQNILANPRIALLFMVPGTDETLRVQGRATLTAEPPVLERLTARGQPALLAIRLEVETCFFHCAKAFRRSQLWQPATWPERAARLVRQAARSATRRWRRAGEEDRRRDRGATTARTCDGRELRRRRGCSMRRSRSVLVVLALLAARAAQEPALPRRRRVRRQPAHARQPHLSDPGGDRPDQRHPVQAAVVRPRGAVDPHQPRRLGHDRDRRAVLECHHRDQRRLRADRLPRPHQGATRCG